jgi:hypothetical protein
MANIPDEKLVETPSKASKAVEAGATPAKKAAKRKKAKKASRRTQIGTLRLQVATQLLAPTYGNAAGGLGTERLRSALKVADELLALNAEQPLPKLPKGGKDSKEPKEGKARSQ